MLPPAHGRVLSLVITVSMQVIAIVDFNFDGNPKSDAQLCCMVEHNFPQEPYRTCYEKFKKPEWNKEARMCVHQCYYDAIGMIIGGEKIQSDKYHAYGDSLEPPLRNAFAHALKVCTNITAKVITQLAAMRQTFKCNPIAYLFNRCLSEVCIANCPADRWMNSSLCDQLALKLKKRLGAGALLSL